MPEKAPRKTPKKPAPRRRTSARTASAKTAVAPPRRRAQRRVPRLHRRARLRQLAIRLLSVAAVALLCYFTYIYIVAPYSSKWRALYGTETYPDGYSIRGIDVSHHQGTIDWQRVREAEIKGEPVSFVFIKATEGQSHLDENFNENFYEARERGLLRGAYHYFKPNVSARSQAEYFLKQVHLEEGDLPPVLDIEETGNLTKAELRRAALTWLRIVEERYGVPPILYTGYKFRRDNLNTKDFEHYPYWIAHYYVRELSYKGTWRFWQHTDQGHIAGIRTKVDLNIYSGSMYELRKMCIPEEDEGEE